MMMKKMILICMILASCKKSDSSNTDTTVNNGLKPLIKSGQTIKLMTYNIHHANPPAQNAAVIDVDAIAAVINAESPDFVALQEVDKNTTRSGVSLDEAQSIASKTHMTWYFSKSIDYQGGEYGVAILSRYNIYEKTRYALPIADGETGELRSVAMITVEAEHGKVCFASTHLEESAAASRLVQARKLLDIHSELLYPLIIAGDFNATPADTVISLLKQQFTPGCIGSCPYTIPATAPSRTIDYIFLSHEAASLFGVISYTTSDESKASDHRPVVATLKYN